ncbi:MAG TPA: prepilin-type N-terminal cleavage/methylation domain-containing protein [Longimicrobiales bacterium]|nr:prepilin-type N-terminal cleavage/methylation domain-containing protein [Longimicrobiales bacterium]
MTPPAHPPAGRGDARGVSQVRSGFTLVEVIVAIVVLTAGVLALAGATAHVVREVTLADITTERALALQSVVEHVQATSFASVGSGSDTVGNFTLLWGSVAESPTSKLVTVVTSGPGLRTTGAGSFPSLGPQVVDSFAFRVISR